MHGVPRRSSGSEAMTPPGDAQWIDAVAATFVSYRRMIDGAVSQLSDAELMARPRADMSSVAVVLRHLGGNLRSRWSDFLTTDGEKPDRDRDGEFADWDGDRESLMSFFSSGWDALTDALRTIDATTMRQPVFIRGERHSVADALLRSLTHVAYHVGQIMVIARMAHGGEWNWLTIPPGGSLQHNAKTWGAAASRGEPEATMSPTHPRDATNLR